MDLFNLEDTSRHVNHVEETFRPPMASCHVIGRCGRSNVGLLNNYDGHVQAQGREKMYKLVRLRHRYRA